MIFLRYTPFIMNGTLFIRGPKTHSSDLGSYVVVEMFREYPFLLFRYKFLLKKIHTPWFCWVLKKKKAVSQLWPHFILGKAGRGVLIKVAVSSINQNGPRPEVGGTTTVAI